MKRCGRVAELAFSDPAEPTSNEMAVITTLLFRQFELELRSPEVRILYSNSANHPSEARVAYRRKASV